MRKIIKDSTEWVRCLINPKRETYLRIDKQQERKILEGMNYLIAGIIGGVIVALICLIRIETFIGKYDRITEYDGYMILEDLDRMKEKQELKYQES